MWQGIGFSGHGCPLSGPLLQVQTMDKPQPLFLFLKASTPKPHLFHRSPLLMPFLNTTLSINRDFDKTFYSPIWKLTFISKTIVNNYFTATIVFHYICMNLLKADCLSIKKNKNWISCLELYEWLSLYLFSLTTKVHTHFRSLPLYLSLYSPLPLPVSHSLFFLLFPPLSLSFSQTCIIFLSSQIHKHARGRRLPLDLRSFIRNRTWLLLKYLSKPIDRCSYKWRLSWGELDFFPLKTRSRAPYLLLVTWHSIIYVHSKREKKITIFLF